MYCGYISSNSRWVLHTHHSFSFKAEHKFCGLQYKVIVSFVNSCRSFKLLFDYATGLFQRLFNRKPLSQVFSFHAFEYFEYLYCTSSVRIV